MVHGKGRRPEQREQFQRFKDPSQALESFRGDPQFAMTLGKGLAVLRCFSAESPTLANKDIVQQTGFDKATVSRLTYTLVSLGYLDVDRPSRHYRLGSAVLAMGYPLLTHLQLRQMARPFMAELDREIGGAVCLGVRDRLNMTYVEVCKSPDRFESRSADVGLSVPLLGTAIGHAYIAACDAKTRQAIINELRIKLPEPWAQYGEKLLADIASFRQEGCCISYASLSSEVCAIAMPFKTVPGAPLAAFSCVLNANRHSDHSLRQEVLPLLRKLILQLRSLSGSNIALSHEARAGAR
ncbi:MAG: IclR family transcriptional regulator [Pigmentiphaga sp.]|nr:IclR family transcriptional regulator [Pigmentiphaga sp.]